MLPSPFPLQHALYRAPALMRAESLQWRPPRWLEAFIATGTVTGVAQKSLKDAPGDDPRAPLSGLMAHLQPAAAALDGERSVAVASSGRSRTSSSAADFSIATTAVPSAGILHCNNALSDAPVEIASHILSTNTSRLRGCRARRRSGLPLPGSCFLRRVGGSWLGLMGGLAPGKLKSRRGGHSSPRRLHLASAGIQELTAGKTLSALRHWRNPTAANPGVIAQLLRTGVIGSS